MDQVVAHTCEFFGLRAECHDCDAQRFNFPEISAEHALLLVERQGPVVCKSPLLRKMLVVGAQILEHFNRFVLVHHPSDSSSRADCLSRSGADSTRASSARFPRIRRYRSSLA